ncbi:uncharacterized protein LOC131303013 [Rhododendron vialii]|uniref:uncharacterized protein LOC131303013 n=1 Tax=Rhododendron vialii TaxID=182163 RepID=UPI00265E9D20|nr:uncharacterized protein LOC131303013 [Rhododendron vialii]
MVVFLPADLKAKDNTPTTMEGDVVEMGQTAEILNESFSVGLNGPLVIVLKDETEEKNEDRAASVIFERPSPTMNKHIKPLYIAGCLDGMPVNRILVDNGSVANLVPKAMMQRLGKIDQDLNQDDVEVIWADRKPFKASTNHAEAHLYDEGVGPMKVAGLDKVKQADYSFIQTPFSMSVSPSEAEKHVALRTTLSKFEAYLLEKRLMGSQESEEDFSACAAEADVQDPLEEVNLGDSENPKPVYISQLLPEDVKEKFIQLLGEFKSYFAWTYKELPGLSRDLVEHKLPIQLEFRPFKQPPRRMSNEVYLQVKDEIELLFNAGFISTARNLNLASPKDEYPMPVVDQLVDGASGHKVLSFIDGHSGYNQIFIDEADTAKTSFRCPGALGTFEWVIYIDDIVVKSQSYDEHLEHWRKSFLRMQQFDLKVNPLKCTFGVSSGKFLGFLVHNRGIEVDKNKAKAIMEAKPPTTKKELQKLLGSFNFLRRFISNLAGRVQANHQKAFDEIKGYLATAPVLMPPIKNRPLKLYISTAEGSIGGLLAQDNAQGKEQAIKGQALANFLADHPCVDIGDESEISLNALEISLTPWTLLFDGSRTQQASGCGVIIISPQRLRTELSFQFDFPCTNNQAEYEVVVIGLEILRELEAREVKIVGDSNLVINHLAGTFKCYSEDLAPYCMAAVQLIQDFDNVTVKHVTRSMNTEANSLAQASTGLKLAPETIHKIITVQKRLLPYVRMRGLGLEVFTSDFTGEELDDEPENDWRTPIISFLKRPHHRASRKVRRRAMSNILVGDELHKKRPEDDLLLRCLGHPEAMTVMSEVHEGCQPCQAHGPIQRVPTADYHAVVKPWPFRGWALDVIGKIYPPSSGNHTYILVATDYFTKWAEAVPLKSVDQQEVIKVIEERIIHRFRLPEHLVADRGTIFMGEQVVNFAAQQNIIISNSTPYYAQGNGQAESTNRTLVNIIEKMVEDNPRALHKLLSEALWAYRTSKKEATNITPYMLVYGHDPVLPMEVAVKSTRIAYQNGLTPADYTQAMLMELEDLDEVRLAALDHMLVQKRRVARSYDKRVRKKSFTEGDLVWKAVFPLWEKNPRYGKWSPTWEGPYQIAQVLKGNFYLLMDLNGGLFKHLTNGKYLKHHYPTMWEMRDFGEIQPNKP